MSKLFEDHIEYPSILVAKDTLLLYGIRSAAIRKESEMRGLKAWAEFYQISGRSVNCYFTQISYT